MNRSMSHITNCFKPCIWTYRQLQCKNSEAGLYKLWNPAIPDWRTWRTWETWRTGKTWRKSLLFYVCIFVKINTFTLSPPPKVQRALKCTDPFKIPGYPALVQLTQASRSSKVQIAKDARFLGRTSRICSKMFWHIILTSESKEQTKQSFFCFPKSI